MRLLCATILLSAALAPAHGATVLYKQNFENPNQFVNDGGDVNIFRSVNALYGGQPAGIGIAQRSTVETLLIGGAQAWGTGFLDPQGRAGNYALGMLSGVQDDLLGFSFNVGAFKYLNIRFDISSIDLDRWGGPYVAGGGESPTFRLSLFDNPSGNANVGSGTLLDTIVLSGLPSRARNTFNWITQIAALDTTGNTNGNVTMQIDLLWGGYASMDNFILAGSEIANDVFEPVNAVSEPGAMGLFGFAGALLALVRRRPSPRRRKA